VELILTWLGIILLGLFCLLGLALLVLGLPGTFVIVIASAVYAWATGFQALTLATLGILLTMALVGEAIEFASTVLGGKERPTRRVAIAAVLGAIFGGIFGAPFFFGIGALFGALGGAFAGAWLASTSEGSSHDQAVRHGIDALRGRLLGFIVKAAIAFAMTVVALGAAI
jgi:uncharacterized protein YqgC (DUF456 family)